MIHEYIKTSSEETLNKPELFLLELSRIPAFDERIYCLVYQNKFNESIASVDFKLNNMLTVCDELLSSDKVRKILGIILACGNNMNATNKSRGDADGFDLAILPNLKDVKSKDNTTNLLQYIAFYFVNKIDDELTKLPLPDPSDFNFVAQVNFDEIEKELKRINNELNDIEQRVENVLKASTTMVDGVESKTNEMTVSSQLNEQFKTRVSEFLKNARDECKEQEENFDKCKVRFEKVTCVYCVKPRPGESQVTPEYFFSLWVTFCQHFKDAWKRETQKLNKQR
jgi:formin 2